MECYYGNVFGRDDCTEVATTTVQDATGPSTYIERPACASCAAYEANREPSDDDLYNGFGMEGGIRYNPYPEKVR